jgi:transposase
LGLGRKDVRMPRTRPPYPPEFRREALELVRSGRSIRDIAESLGVSAQTLRNWSRQDDVDAGRAEGLTSAEREELRRLRRENRRLEPGAGDPQEGGGLCDHERWRQLDVEAGVVEGGAVQDMEVWPSAAALQGEAANHRKLRRSRAGVVSVVETARRERVRWDLRRRTRVNH